MASIIGFGALLLLVLAFFAWAISRTRAPKIYIGETPLRPTVPTPRPLPVIAPNPAPVPVAPPVAAPEVVVRIQADVSMPGLDVVGESHYQEALEKLAGGRTEEGCELEVFLKMIPESDNPHDPNAVAVEIDGELVGYLSKSSAKKYRLAFQGLTTDEWPARIVGGWDRGDGDTGSFGVKLLE